MTLLSKPATADGNYAISTVTKHGQDTYFATLFAHGTWGSGTITWKISFDGGTTLITLTDYTGVSVTQTADGAFNMNFGNGNGRDTDPIIYAVLSGSTNPALTVGVCDNN